MSTDGPSYFSVDAMFPDTVLISHQPGKMVKSTSPGVASRWETDYSATPLYFSVPYEQDEKGNVTIGKPTEVKLALKEIAEMIEEAKALPSLTMVLDSEIPVEAYFGGLTERMGNCSRVGGSDKMGNYEEPNGPTSKKRIAKRIAGVKMKRTSSSAQAAQPASAM